MSALVEKRCCKNSSLVTPEQKEIRLNLLRDVELWLGVGRAVQLWFSSIVVLQELLQA